VPGTIYSATVDIPSTCLTFLAGHKIRVAISSSNYPQYNRNMNTGKAMYPGFNPDSLINPVTANNTVYMNNTDFSYITLPVDLSVSVNESANTVTDFEIFPNPAKDEFTVRFKKETKGILNLMDVSGKLVLKTTVGGETKKISSRELESGVYFLYLLSGTETSIKKIIISK